MGIAFESDADGGAEVRTRRGSLAFIHAPSGPRSDASVMAARHGLRARRAQTVTQPVPDCARRQHQVFQGDGAGIVGDDAFEVPAIPGRLYPPSSLRTW